MWLTRAFRARLAQSRKDDRPVSHPEGPTAMPSVTGWEVLYVSDDDSFRTVQLHIPVDGRFYKATEITPVVLEGVNGWRVDDSDPINARVVSGTQGSKPLNKAIRDGLINVVAASYRTPPTEQLTA